jgi:purine-binding chemotaxis protein CheW
MVLITPIIAAPRGVTGMINYHGEILPVFSLRHRLSFPDRELTPEDLLIITGTGRRKVALIADQVTGVEIFSEKPVTAEDIVPGLSGILGVIRTSDGMILITDLERFLLPEEELIVQDALSVPGPGDNA